MTKCTVENVGNVEKCVKLINKSVMKGTGIYGNQMEHRKNPSPIWGSYIPVSFIVYDDDDDDDDNKKKNNITVVYIALFPVAQ